MAGRRHRLPTTTRTAPAVPLRGKQNGQDDLGGRGAAVGHRADRFRDRVIFPIIHNGEILGFIGRRHPDLTDTDRGGPKYLNTADTPLFHKGAQLFGVVDDLLDQGAVPVIVEGPLDAIAVTLASAGRYLGVAPLGTSLTDEQAGYLGLPVEGPYKSDHYRY